MYKQLKILNNNLLIKKYQLYTSNFFLTLPKRQQFFTIFNLTTLRQLNISAGRFLASFGRKAKFFKRNPKNITSIVLQLKKTYIHILKYIYFFYIKNYTKRQFLFFQKFLSLLQPTVEYFIHRQSFIPRFLPKKRIKRRVLRLLKQQ